MNPVVLAFVAVIICSIEEILFRYLMLNKSCPWATLLYYYITCLVVSVPFLNLEGLLLVEPLHVICLMLAGGCWFAGDFFDVKVYEDLEASVSLIFGVAKLIIITMAGVFLFGENLSTPSLVGMVLIIAAMTLQFQSMPRKDSRAFRYKALSVAFLSCGLILDKYLTEHVSEGIIIFYGYLIPGLILALFGYRTVKKIPDVIRLASWAFFVVPVLGSIGVFCFIHALSTGDLSTTYIIQQTIILFVFVLEILILKDKENFVRKGISAVICTGGAICMCLG